MDPTSGRPSTELLEPVNLHLNIKRNLAASWYKKMVAVEINGDLKPMMVGRGGRDRGGGGEGEGGGGVNETYTFRVTHYKYHINSDLSVLVFETS